MTRAEDELFLEIMDTVRNMDLSDAESSDELMSRFIQVYQDKVSDKNPKILKALKQCMPEEFV